jgi:hypothetical protein
MSTLAEFAATHVYERSAGSCKVCLDPRRAEIEEGRTKGLAYALISRWTLSDGVISTKTLGRHFSEGHHKRG